LRSGHISGARATAWARSDRYRRRRARHRSQYDTRALNMRAALPKPLLLAFTGTPLIAGEERTKEVFGDGQRHHAVGMVYATLNKR